MTPEIPAYSSIALEAALAAFFAQLYVEAESLPLFLEIYEDLNDDLY